MSGLVEFRFDPQKNAQLIAERRIGFEEIITEIDNGNLLAIRKHHNSKKYPHQKIMYVKCLEEVYLVPYVHEGDGAIFLKTLYSSRKARKQFGLDS